MIILGIWGQAAPQYCNINTIISLKYTKRHLNLFLKGKKRMTS